MKPEATLAPRGSAAQGGPGPSPGRGPEPAPRAPSSGLPETSLAPGPAVRPLASAALFATIYLAVCGAYIVVSGDLAARLATSVSALERIERLKGLVFIALTGALYFGLTFFLLRRIAAQQQRILRQQTALVMAEGRAMAGIFAASLAHDMNNVLTLARGHFDLLAPALKDPRVIEAGARVDRAIDDLTVLSRRLMTVGRAGTAGKMETLDLKTLAERTAALAPAHAAVRECRLSVSAREPVHVRGNESLIARALLNLILNSAEATNGSGRIEIRVQREGSNVNLEVHDDGPGIPVEKRAAIFDPFYTTKTDGTGLGLLSVKVCAEEHRGALEVTDSDLGGACFRITIPASVSGS